MKFIFLDAPASLVTGSSVGEWVILFQIFNKCNNSVNTVDTCSTVNTVNTFNTVNTANTVNVVNTVNRINTVNIVNTVTRINTFNKYSQYSQTSASSGQLWSIFCTQSGIFCFKITHACFNFVFSSDMLHFVFWEVCSLSMSAIMGVWTIGFNAPFCKDQGRRQVPNWYHHHQTCLNRNKLAKARKMRKPPGTLGLKKFGPGKLRVKKVWGNSIVYRKAKLWKIIIWLSSIINCIGWWYKIIWWYCIIC